MNVEGLRAGPVADAIRRERLLVVIRHVTPQEALLALVDGLAEAGVRIFEITSDARAAVPDLAAVVARLHARPDGPYLVGAGTVLRRGELEAARRAGVDFAAAPLLDPLLVATAVEEGLPFLPGALTPTEVAAAWAAGATFVKVFPASAVGPSFVRQLGVSMPEAQLIPIGGIDAASAAPYLEAGAAAVGIGSAMTRGNASARRAIIDAIVRPGRGR